MKESRTKERLLSLNDRHCARWCFICFTLFNPPNSTEVSVLPLFFKGGNTLREVSNITVPGQPAARSCRSFKITALTTNREMGREGPRKMLLVAFAGLN